MVLLIRCFIYFFFFWGGGGVIELLSMNKDSRDESHWAGEWALAERARVILDNAAMVNSIHERWRTTNCQWGQSFPNGVSTKGGIRFALWQQRAPFCALSLSAVKATWRFLSTPTACTTTSLHPVAKGSGKNVDAQASGFRFSFTTSRRSKCQIFTHDASYYSDKHWNTFQWKRRSIFQINK